MCLTPTVNIPISETKRLARKIAAVFFVLLRIFYSQSYMVIQTQYVGNTVFNIYCLLFKKRYKQYVRHTIFNIVYMKIHTICRPYNIEYL